MKLAGKIHKIYIDEGLLGVVKHSFLSIYYFVFFPIAYIRIKLMSQEVSLIKLIDFVEQGFKGIISALQNKSELLAYLIFLKDKNIEYALEIGTCRGGSLFLLTRVVQSNSLIISIDLPGGKFGGGYSWWRAFLYRSFRMKDQQLYLLRLNSHKKESMDITKTILNGKSLDFLFIDGDHTYEGVSEDFKMYAPLVKDGGYIAFHDIAITHDKDMKVNVFWNEIKKKYVYREFIEDSKHGTIPIGIGIIDFKR